MTRFADINKRNNKVMQNANPSLGKNSIFATHTAHIAELLSSPGIAP